MTNGPNEQDLADLKAKNTAAQNLKETLIELQSAQAGVTEQTMRGAQAASQFANSSAEQKQAAIDVLNAFIQQAKATGEGTELIRQHREQIALLKSDMRELSDASASITDTIRGMWGITNQWSSNVAASLVAGKAAGKGFGETFSKVSGGLKNAVDKQNMWGSSALKVTELVAGGFMGIVQQSMSLTNAIDQQTTSFKIATGASQKYVSAIPSLEAKFYSLGLSMEESAALMGSLYSSVTGFTNMSPAHQRSVKETAAVLQTLGIDSQTTAANMEIMTRSMGMSGTQAAQVNRELFTLAQQLGISTNRMMEDFTRLGPQLVVHGQNATHIFRRLEAAAKSSGVAIDRMISISAKFDRFDTAAESVGHLNAVLGGPYLSVMKMIQTTDPTDRMRMLAAATRQAGVSFDSLGYYERKAIAEAAGLQDVNELALIMRNRFDLVADSQHKSAYELEKLAEQNQEYKTIQDELKQAMRALAVPLTQVLQSFKTLLNWFQNSPGIINTVVYAVVGLKGAFLALNTAATIASMTTSSFLTTLGPFAIMAVGAAAAIGLIATAMMHETHSPPLFAKDGGMSRAARQTYSLANAFSATAAQARLASPELRKLGTDLNSMPDSKMIHIKKVFDAEAGVAEAAKGANITRQTVALLGAATAGAAGYGGRPIQNHMDVTVDLDGKIVGHAVAKQFNKA